MDNSQSLNRLRLFRFNEEQKELLFEMVQQLTMVLSDFRFNDPDKDHELIRQHAAMSGKRDGLMQILAFDDAALREANDKLASAISPEDSPETLGG